MIHEKTGVDLVKTLGALILAPVSFFAVALIAGGLYTVLNTIFTVIRPEIIQTMGVIIGTVSGTYVARIACDKWLLGYQPQVIFLEFIAFAVAGASLEFLVLPFEWSKFPSYVQMPVLGFMAYNLFWRYGAID